MTHASGNPVYEILRKTVDWSLFYMCGRTDRNGKASSCFSQFFCAKWDKIQAIIELWRSKSKFLKKNTKLKIHKTMVRPVVTYWSETGTVTAKDENNIRIFERQILRKIFGPVNIDSVWRIRNNMEIDNLMEGADIVRFIKAQRIKWLGHIQRMDQAWPTRKLLDWKPMGTRPVRKLRQRWQEDVMEDLKKLEVKNWKEAAKGRRTWRDLDEKAKTHKGFF